MGVEQEAYDNFSGYATPGGDINTVPGYTDWAAANPELVQYAQQGYSAGQQSASQQLDFTSMMESFKPYQPTADDRLMRSLSDRNLDFGGIEAQWRQDASNWNVGNNTFESVYGATEEDRFYQYDSGIKYTSSDSSYDATGRWLPKSRQELIDQYQAGGLEGLNIQGSTGSLSQGLGDYNQAYGAYLTAGEQATQSVNTQISSEMSNAALLGIDYKMTDDLKKQRINDAFAGIWSTEDQASLEGLQGSYGDFETYDTDLFTRGDATAAGPIDAGTDIKSQSQQFATSTPDLLEEEEQLGGVTNILGV